MHFGILGQKWGIRRYQNYDGTLTEEDKIRYGKLQKAVESKKAVEEAYKPIFDKTDTWMAEIGSAMASDFVDQKSKFYNPKYDLGDSIDIQAIEKDYENMVYKTYHDLFKDKSFKNNCDTYYQAYTKYWELRKDAFGDLNKIKHPEKDPILRELSMKIDLTYDMQEAGYFCDPKNLELSPKELTHKITYGLFD